MEVACRVVHERCDRPELLLRGVERGGDAFGLTDVGRHGAAGSEQLDRLLERLSPPSEHGDLGAQAAQLERHRPSQPAAAARHEHDSVRERSAGQHQDSSSL